MKKITDLEKFALEQIFRPYQNMAGYGDIPLDKLPVELDYIPKYAETYPEWWKLVKDRIKRIKFYFPRYICHPLVNMLEEVQSERR
jgi:hypothetical protein